MTYDFVLGQLRLALVAFLSFAGGKGWITPTDASAITQIASPLALIMLPVLWSWSANWRKKYVAHDATVLPPKVVVMLIAGICLALASPLPLYAADVAHPATAAPAPAINWTGAAACTPLSCTGFYAGGGIGGNGSNMDVLGNGVNGSVAGGGSIPAIDVGYIYKNANWLFAAEAGIGYQMNSNVSINGIAASQNGIFAYQVVRGGGDLAPLFGGQNPVTIPPSLSNALISLYVQTGTAEKGLPGMSLQTGAVGGAGAYFDIGPHSMINLDYMNVSGIHDINGKTLPLNVVSVKYQYKF